MIKQIDGATLKRLFLSGANHLANNKKTVDDLNVFPVPDGDTGTNMSMTVSAAAGQLGTVEENSVSRVAECIAAASLRGARGNSGVISSQLFRGFYKGLGKLDAVGTAELAEAFKSASDTAYKAVMKPTEGTILTVARQTAEQAVRIAAETEDLLSFAEQVVACANASLNKTPELLPVLKQAGVVDAGGKGLVTLLEGALEALRGNDVTAEQVETQPSVAVNRTEIDTANIKFMYCTEFIINKKASRSVTSFRGAIESKGDCMLVIDDDDVVKVHIHTNHPGYILEQAVKIGELSNIKIDNMKLQHNESIPEEAAPKEQPPLKKYGVVAVAAGDGLQQIFTELGTDRIVQGGQSMNPSTADILEAVDAVHAEVVFILPNNKNIILAAEQVEGLTDKQVVVIPTKTVPQGISALLTLDPSADTEQNREQMLEAVGLVKTGSVTFAARDSEMDGMEIHKDDIMGLSEGKITVLGTEPNAVAAEIISQLGDEHAAMISIYYGEEVSAEQAEALASEVRNQYPRVDCMVHAGGQPLYYYILSVE